MLSEAKMTNDQYTLCPFKKKPKLKTRRTSFSPHLCSVDVTQQEYESKHSQKEEDDSIFGKFLAQSAFLLCPMIRLHFPVCFPLR